MCKKDMDITIPDKKEIFKDSVCVSIAQRDVSWHQKCLGILSSEKGVYVIHHRKSIKYIGKTNGASMSFGKRLRRHFQERAAGNKHTYPKLAELITPPDIKVKMLPLNEIKKYISHEIRSINELDLIPLFEAALIVAYQPKFQCENSKNT